MKQWFILALAGMVYACQTAVEQGLEHHDSGKLMAVDALKGRPAGDTAHHLADTAKIEDLSLPAGSINTRDVHPQQVVAFAKTLIGIPYKYASTDPQQGFDCSGFITYVFRHFNIVVPRSSIDFTNVGKEIPVTAAKPGDLILFTGTDSTERFVGHMGIVVSNENQQLHFIHSTSGKAYGVTITPLNDYYKGRYVKTIRIFPQNDAG